VTPDKKPDEMTEEELARYYEEREGDVSLWQRKSRPIRVRRGSPSIVLSVRLAPEELEELYEAAERMGETVSDFIRKGALRRARTGEPSTA
jgi:hypothetical protein